MRYPLMSLLLVVAVCVSADTAVRKVGAPLADDLEITDIEAIVGDPDSWAGKLVRITGEVIGVCTRQGCWMDLVSPNDATLRVKVEDGVMVFPVDAVGLEATAEGEVEILEMSREKYEAWLRHVAEEANQPFDPSQVGESPYRIVRLRGRGAEIYGS